MRCVIRLSLVVLQLQVLLAGTGCHEIFPFEVPEPSFDASHGPVDLGRPGNDGDAATLADADAQIPDLSVAPDAFDPTAPFSSPTVVPELSTTADEDDPTLTADMLEIYFVRGEDIWRSTRSTLAASWTAPARVDELSSGSSETNPEVAADGLTIFVCSTRSHAAAKGGLDIYVAERASRGAPWGTLQPVVELNSSATDANASPTPDLLSVFLASTRDGDYEIYSSTRPSTTAPWGQPAKVPGVNSTASDYGPWVDATTTVVYFVSYRTGQPGEAIWVATRPDTASPFGTPIPVPGLSSKANDEDPWLSPDMKTIYFAGNRNGNYEVLVAHRP